MPMDTQYPHLKFNLPTWDWPHMGKPRNSLKRIVLNIQAINSTLISVYIYVSLSLFLCAVCMYAGMAVEQPLNNWKIMEKIRVFSTSQQLDYVVSFFMRFPKATRFGYDNLHFVFTAEAARYTVV